MRNVLFCLLLLISACSEVPPEINPRMDGMQDPGDTATVDVQERQVLIEEFTGVRCVNCPAGAAAIERLMEQHEGRIIAVSIHAGFFARPYQETSRYDFRTNAGNSLQSYLGEPLGYPTAVVNRRRFEGEPDLQLGQSLWPGYVQQELARPPRLYLDMDVNYNAVSRNLDVTVQLSVAEDIPEEEIRLSLALTEDGIADAQLTPEGEKPDYLHNHVLRDMITPFDGTPLETPLTSGENRSQRFSYQLPEAWQTERCHLVAFVHLAGEQKEVLQAIERGLVN